MRTTLQLPHDVAVDAKRAAMEAGTTFTAFVADALREALARRRPDGRPPSPVRLKTYGRKGLNDGVDLDDSAALLDRMEGR